MLFNFLNDLMLSCYKRNESYCIFSSNELVIFKNDSANKSIASFPDIEILLPNVLGVNILLQG